MKRESDFRLGLVTLLIACCAAGCSHMRETNECGLVGAWRGKVQFTSGAFAATTNLEFCYVFNEGGTMTESSNYDGAPPVPPAYGVWCKCGDRRFQAKYLYFWTKAPNAFRPRAGGTHDLPCTGGRQYRFGGGWRRT